ncbi:MAG: hypothetical protein EBZ69_03345 [Alphaproteobacteria bacterium]|nr:hypothetical protein [Alphaproteobacteria bacterium]NDC55836.1 hypothetical protein [Alphaproteobacteria bacterium]NDG03995.1 hypothetical protein [Alphaproteobacteria bacterium]
MEKKMSEETLDLYGMLQQAREQFTAVASEILLRIARDGAQNLSETAEISVQAFLEEVAKHQVYTQDARAFNFDRLKNGFLHLTNSMRNKQSGSRLDIDLLYPNGAHAII